VRDPLSCIPKRALPGSSAGVPSPSYGCFRAVLLPGPPHPSASHPCQKLQKISRSIRPEDDLPVVCAESPRHGSTTFRPVRWLAAVYGRGQPDTTPALLPWRFYYCSFSSQENRPTSVLSDARVPHLHCYPVVPTMWQQPSPPSFKHHEDRIGRPDGSRSERKSDIIHCLRRNTPPLAERILP
jgi:hypothetical protein